MNLTSRKSLFINAAIIILVALLLWLFTKDRPATKDPVKMPEEGLTIITELSPNNFVIKEDGTFGGLQPELANLFLSDTKLHWLPSDSRSSAVSALLNGEADIYASSVPLASGGEFEGTTATIPVYSTAFALIYPKGTDWISDFSDTEVETIIYGSSDDPSIERIVQNISDLSYPSLRYKALALPGQEVALKVFKGEIKYALVEKKLAEKIGETTGDSILISTDLTFSSNQVWLVKEGRDSLLNHLNERIEAAKETSAYLEVINRNFGK